MADYTFSGGLVIKLNPRYPSDHKNNGKLVVEGAIESLSNELILEGVKIDGDVISSSVQNSDLNLEGNGTGSVIIEDITITDNNISSKTLNSDLNLEGNGTGSVIIEDITITDNNISSKTLNSDLNLEGNGTGYLILEENKWPKTDGSADQILKTNGSGELSWINQPGGGSGLTTTTVNSSTYSSTASDDVLLVDYTSTGTVTIDLIDATTAGKKTVSIKDSGGNAFTNPITINRTSTDTIDGETSVVISEDLNSLTLASNGVDAWYLI